MRALFTAATGMGAQQLNIDNISNNLANVNTTGFKRGRVDFQDLLYEAVRPAGASATASTEVPTGVQVGHGVQVASIQKLFTQGSYLRTEQPLDMVIEGEGFFSVTLPDGSLGYTRDGAFKRSATGLIVTSNGDPLTQQITIPENATNLTIGRDGVVSYSTAGSTTPTLGGTILVSRFANPAGLNAVGQNLFKETASSGTATEGTPGTEGFGTLLQGNLEQSNVSMVEELVGMIIAQRAYEINSKAITTSDEMLQTATQLKR